MKSVKIDTVGKINRVMNHQLMAELTIWGASTALLNINPNMISDSLNITSYNMGIDGVNIDQYNGLLEEFIKSTKNSKYLIIVIDIISGFEKRNKIYELHNWIHHLDNSRIYNSLYDIDRNTIFKAKYVPFYSISLYNKHALPYFVKAINNHSNTINNDNLGFRPESIEMNTSMNDNIQRFNVDYDLSVFNKFKTTCLLAKKNNIKPIIVITPCFYKGLEKIKNKAEFWRLINSLKKEGLLVLNFIDTSISYDSSNFKDNTHLNAKGADKLTNLLIQQINSSSL